MFYEEGRKSCTFTGHRPDRLEASEKKVIEWLEAQIDKAYEDGFVDFISGMQRGVDIWAAEKVIRLKKEGKPVRLIACVPFKGMENIWDISWKKRFNYVIENADKIHYVSSHSGRTAFFMRNEWMVDRASRLIAVFTGAPGGTKKTLEYAKKKEIEVIRWGENEPLNKHSNKSKVVSIEKSEPLTSSLSDILKNMKFDTIYVVNDARNITPEERRLIEEDIKKHKKEN